MVLYHFVNPSEGRIFVIPEDLFTPGLLLAAAIAALGGTLRGFAGTGNSMLMTPLYALIFGPVATVAFIVVSLVFALGAMTQVMLASGIDPITWHGLLITPLIAVSLILASVVFALASALFRINEEAGQLISETRATIEALRDKIGEKDI